MLRLAGNGVDGAVDGGVARVDDVSERREQCRVDECDAEAERADGEHQREEAGAHGDHEAGDAFEREPSGGKCPLECGAELGELHSKDDAGDVWEEGEEPHEARLHFGALERVAHPLGERRLEERERHVGHHEASGAHGDERVENEPPDGRPDGQFCRELRTRLSHRLHHNQQKSAVQQRDHCERQERQRLPGHKVQYATDYAPKTHIKDKLINKKFLQRVQYKYTGERSSSVVASRVPYLCCTYSAQY